MRENQQMLKLVQNLGAILVKKKSLVNLLRMLGKFRLMTNKKIKGENKKLSIKETHQ